MKFKINHTKKSKDGKHHYYTSEQWDSRKPWIMVVNSSGALPPDEFRVRLKKEGYGGLILVNLLSIVSYDLSKSNYYKLDTPEAAKNREVITELLNYAEAVVIAWGDFPPLKPKDLNNLNSQIRYVLTIIQSFNLKILCWGVTENKNPWSLISSVQRGKFLIPYIT